MAKILKQVVVVPGEGSRRCQRCDLRDGVKAAERAETTEAAPELGDSLANGDVTGAHVDVVGDALRELEPGMRQKLLAHIGELTVAAKRSAARTAIRPCSRAH